MGRGPRPGDHSHSGMCILNCRISWAFLCYLFDIAIYSSGVTDIVTCEVMALLITHLSDFSFFFLASGLQAGLGIGPVHSPHRHQSSSHHFQQSSDDDSQHQPHQHYKQPGDPQHSGRGDWPQLCNRLCEGAHSPTSGVTGQRDVFRRAQSDRWVSSRVWCDCFECLSAVWILFAACLNVFLVCSLCLSTFVRLTDISQHILYATGKHIHLLFSFPQGWSPLSRACKRWRRTIPTEKACTRAP